MRALIIEDDAEIAAYVAKGLREYGHKVEVAADGHEGLKLANGQRFDVLVVDRMLPGVDGLSIIKSLRAAGNKTPALVLSALGDVNDRVGGLNSGADDYLVKPFAFAELMARLEALMRRQRDAGQGPTTKLEAGDLVMDLVTRKVMRGVEKISLLGREFKLLEFLLRHKGHIVTRTMLLEQVWDYRFDPQTNVIDVHISRLRRKVDKGFAVALIKTIRGSGYMIDDEGSA